VDARFLNSGALPGTENMAIDAQLLEAGVPALRLYQWARPTLSLGYFQKLEDVADEAFMRANGVDLCRRPTGGGAILHDRELTFSLCLPAAPPALQGSINDSYLALTQPLLDVLKGLGVQASFRGDCATSKTPNCFAGSACPDLVVDGKKVFGSAQRRKENAVLMHGSLLFEIREALWQGVFGGEVGLGYASVGHAGEDWEGLLKRAYSAALGLDFSASGQAKAALLS